MNTKNDFRTAQLKRLAAAKTQTQAVGAALLTQLLATTQWQQAQTIGLTVSGPLEIPTAPIIASALAAHKQVFLPRVMPKRQMVFLPDPGPAGRVQSSFGLFEPPYEAEKVATHLDLLIVPGIAFSLSDGYRVGFGGGYYDRFLARFTGETLALVAPVMAYPEAIWPRESFDVPLTTLLV